MGIDVLRELPEFPGAGFLQAQAILPPGDLTDAPVYPAQRGEQPADDQAQHRGHYQGKEQQEALGVPGFLLSGPVDPCELPYSKKLIFLAFDGQEGGGHDMIPVPVFFNDGAALFPVKRFLLHAFQKAAGAQFYGGVG